MIFQNSVVVEMLFGRNICRLMKVVELFIFVEIFSCSDIIEHKTADE